MLFLLCDEFGVITGLCRHPLLYLSFVSCHISFDEKVQVQFCIEIEVFREQFWLHEGMGLFVCHVVCFILL